MRLCVPKSHQGCITSLWLKGTAAKEKRWCVVVVASQTANAFDHCRHISDVAFAGHTVSKNSFTFSKQRFRHDFIKCIWIIGIVHTWHNWSHLHFSAECIEFLLYRYFWLISFTSYISVFTSTILHTFSWSRWQLFDATRTVTEKVAPSFEWTI